MQLDIFQVNGHTESREIQLVQIEQLHPHPQNPRLSLNEELVQQIQSLIEQNGFEPCYALLVRPFEDGYQIISGHTRREAASRAGLQYLPCWIREMTDEDAYLQLRIANNQSELSPLEEGRHIAGYVEVGKWGKSISAYAEKIGVPRQTLDFRYNAWRVFNKVASREATLNDKFRHLTAISRSDESDWEMLVDLLLKQDWSVRQTESAATAVKSIEIPEVLHHWLPPEKWKKEAAVNAANGEDRMVRDVTGWVATAIDCLNSLPIARAVWRFNGSGRPYQEDLNLQDRFLQQLPELKNPSQSRVKTLTSKLLEEVAKLDQEYEEWVISQKSKEEQSRQLEEKHRQRLAIESKYSPVGFCGDVREWEFEPASFDAIITDPPYLLSNGGITVRSGKQTSVDKNFDDSVGQAIGPEVWVKIAAQALKPGGSLVVTCTEHLLFDCDLEGICVESGLERRQILIWDKPNASPNLSADRFAQCFEFVYVATKPGAKPYFGYEDVQLDGKQARSVISMPQCAGKERLGWHDTQKPLTLAELLTVAYVPPGGKVADLFAGTGTFAIAAKKLGRIAHWVERNPDFFAKTSSRIESVALPPSLF